MAAISDSDLAEVDRFLESKKRLADAIPVWGPSPRPGEMQAVWSIIDDLGVVRANLRFRLSVTSREQPSVSVIFRGNSVTRLDIVPIKVCEDNPPWAARIGLPAKVCGSHCHTWRDNRWHIERSGIWEMPCRRPVESALRRIPQMLPWIAEAAGVELSPEQRLFDIPPKTELFER